MRHLVDSIQKTTQSCSRQHLYPFMKFSLELQLLTTFICIVASYSCCLKNHLIFFRVCTFQNEHLMCSKKYLQQLEIKPFGVKHVRNKKKQNKVTLFQPIFIHFHNLLKVQAHAIYEKLQSNNTQRIRGYYFMKIGFGFFKHICRP